MQNKVYIIGTGRVGSAFAFELRDIGFNVNFLSGKNREQAEKIGADVNAISVSEKVDPDFLNGSEVIFVCVQDRYIREIAEKIAGFKIDLSGKFFFHTSGSETTDAFKALNVSEDYLLSMHPIQTFDKISYGNNRLLENIYFGIEGGAISKSLANEIITSLNSKFLEIPKDKKQLYHSACVVSSNFLVTLLNITSELVGSIGVDKSRTFEIFKPIIEKTLSNISDHGLVNSLTGPFERNDVETISKHLDSIKNELPSLIPFYTLLGMETVKVAFKKESLDLRNVISILDLMNDYIMKESNIPNKTSN